MAEFDTTNATATPEDVLNGKTAYVNGEKIKGTIQSKLGGSFTPTLESQVVCPAGVYTSSAFSIKGDANLKPANIRKGVEIFGVEGTMQGNDAPSGTLPANVRTISVEPNNHEGGTVHGGGAVSQGMTITVNANPVGKFNFYGWEERGSTVSEDAEYTFKVESSRNLKAMFGDTHKPLPSGYTEVEWIQNVDVSSYFHISVTESGRNYIEVSFPIGSGMGDNGGKVVEFPYNIQPYDVVAYISAANNTFIYHYYEWLFNNYYSRSKQIYPTTLDNGVYGITTDAYSTINLPSATASESQIIRIHYVKLRGHDLIPCINQQDVVGLYDLTSDEFISPAKGRFITIYDGNFYTISLTNSNPQWGTISGDGAYEEGTSVTVTAEPNDGYKFVSWKEDGKVVSNEASYTFTVERDRQLVAEFTVLSYYSISVDIQPEGSGTVTGDGRYRENDTVSLRATANYKYKFADWEENGESISQSASYTFNADRNRNLVADFVDKLPTGYTYVEYIESGGKSYINTGIKPSSNTIIDMDVEPKDSPSTTYKYFVGSYLLPASGTKYCLYVAWGNTGNTSTTGVLAALGSFTTLPWTTISSERAARRMNVQVRTGTKTVSVDGNSKTVGNNTFSTSMTNIFLLAYSADTSTMLPAKLYSCQIHQSNKLIRDFVPCINPEGVAGMYDAVEDVFYPSKSSTAFTAGPTI